MGQPPPYIEPDLRAEAERVLRIAGKGADTDRALQELQVYQVELQLQNEELQRTHANLERSRRELQLLFEYSPIPYLSLDENLRVVDMSEQARRLLGALRGRPLTGSVASEDRQRVLMALGRAIERPKAGYRLEAWMRPDGLDPWLAAIDIRALPPQSVNEAPRLFVAARDISDLHAERERARRGEAELRQVLELAPDALFVLQGHTIARINEATERLFGTGRRDLLDSSIERWVKKEDLAALDSLLRDVDPERALEVELRIGPLDEPRLVEARAMRIVHGGRDATLVAARDLTERRRLEAQSAQAERMATVGMLVAGVAHEINNPLTFVMLGLQSLERREARAKRPNDRALAQLREVRGGCERIAGIVADLRDFYRADDQQRLVSPNDVVVRTLRMASPKLAHRARVEPCLGQLPNIRCNEGRLAQVLVNLLVNASEAAPRERPVDQNRITVRSWRRGKHVCIAVEDNGSGIAPEVQPKLFEAFFTTRSDEGGSGLGLAISNSLVQQMGGWIDIHSVPGRGARFTINLPVRHEDQVPAETRPRAAEAQMPKRKLRILIVDDEVPVAKALARALRSVASATLLHNGATAIDHLKTHRNYDVVLCDMVMPEGSGADVARYLHAEQPELFRRLVFMTGMAHHYDDLSAEVPTMHKPLDIEVLRGVLMRVAAGGDQADVVPVPGVSESIQDHTPGV